MSVREILRWPDPRLAQVCAPVGAITPEIEVLAADMLETMYAAPGRGLAAPQVGVLLRLFVMDASWKEGMPDPLICIDPVLRVVSDARATNSEGCLSIPGVSAEVTRPAQVVLAWTGLDGATRERAFDGFAAVCVQHELDHLDGVVTFDRLDPSARTALEREYAA